MRHATITGTGLHHPEHLVPNAIFNERHGIDVDAFLVENRNIRQRYYMADDEATSDLVIPAAREALTQAGLGPGDLDLIIVSTDTPDYISPSTAAVVQYKLGAVNAGVFDVNTACSGFVTALDMAGKYIAADEHYRHILVVGAYGMSKWLDFDDYKIATLFADGAGAAVVSASERPGILASTLYADGQYHDYMGIYAGGTFMPVTPEVLARRDHLLRFAKKIPIETNATHWPRLVHTLLDRTGRTAGQVDWFFFTQINITSINQTLDALGVDHARAHNVMDRFAYTGSACIPMALADAARNHLLQPGQFVMFIGSGGGMSMAAVAMDWTVVT